ncbi:MAG: hypothetical protein IKX02_02650, partial [Spirochaetales bacterium]|nr:hypothetical protein [Spirochaetales bacterium]
MRQTVKIFIFIAALAFISCNIGNHDHHHQGDAVISYNANGANFGSVPSTHGSRLNVQDNIGNLEKNGYVFD